MNKHIVIVTILFGILLAFVTAQSTKPNILFILADDYGWANVGYHRTDDPDQEVQTPIIDSLVANGVELDRHYVFKFCSPTRSAIISGRNPIHVNVLNLSPDHYNPNDPVSGFSAVPRNMTGIATKLKGQGYATHMVGKWDAGMATPDHTPLGRGFDTSLHYFHHANDYWTEVAGGCAGAVDLWDTAKPAYGQNNSKTCSQSDQNNCVYEDGLFTNRVLSVIKNHDPATPLYIYWAPHNVHEPLEVPESFLNKFSFIPDPYRRLYQAMVNYLDTNVGLVVDALKAKGLYDNLLIVFSSDNGGPIYNIGRAGANNYPLRGGKMSNWEGGVRVNAFASGGLIPAAQRGSKRTGLITGWDWYATFCSLAGADPTDTRAQAAGLPPIDSFDQWPYVSGQVSTSPRTEVALGDIARDGSTTIVGGVIQGEWKLLVGPVSQNGWTGPFYPNASTTWNSGASIEHCSLIGGCLFNIYDDPTEHFEVGTQHPDIRAQLHQRINEITKTVFSPNRGPVDPEACQTATNEYGGFWGPWLD
jgi:arylsulfatase B